VLKAQSRVRLIRISHVLILALSLVTVLTALFQYQNRLKEFLNLVQPDLISVAYLQLLVQMQPQDVALRLDLAQQLSELGRWHEARKTLIPMLGQDRQSNWPARILMIDIQRKALYSLDSSDPRRADRLHALVARLENLAHEEIPEAYLESLAKLSIEFARPDLAANIYEHLAVADLPRRPHWLAKAGQWHLAASHPEQAGYAYHGAAMASIEAETALNYAFLALDAFRTANAEMTTLPLIKAYLIRFPQNPALLIRAIEIARAHNMLGQAQQWGSQLLATDPTNEGYIEQQLKLALEVGELSAALTFAEQLAQLRPESVTRRRRLAEIAEWNGTPEKALKQWVWLAHHDPVGSAPAHALELARGLADDRARIEMLVLISRQRVLQDTELEELTQAFHREGDLEAESEFFRSYLTRHHPGHFHLGAWKMLAKLQEYQGDFAAAATTWQYIGNNFALTIEAACRRAELIWRLGRREEALGVLSALQSDVPPDRVDFWKLLGEQGWSLKSTEHAWTAYLTLWTAGKADALAAERLILLARDMGRHIEALSIAEASFKQFDEARFLLLGMDEAIATDSWEGLAKLIKIARREQLRFQDSEMYWLQEALFAVHEGHYDDAEVHYQHALRLNPKSIPARVGLLWLAIESNNLQYLTLYLNRWQNEALTEPAFWGAYAVGMTKLGLVKEALPWYARQVKAKPQDVSLLLNYSQTLRQAGQVDAAWRLRDRIFSQFQSLSTQPTILNPQ
jgi:tetratricopeptide (TPR) repeat protein